MELDSIVSTAHQAGLDLIGLSDHIDEADDPEREALVLANRELVARIESPVRVLVGTETTVLSPGKPAAGEQVREALDFVSVAVNHYHLPNVEHPTPRTPEGYAAHHLQMIRATVECPWVDIVVHPFLHGKLAGIDQTQVIASYDSAETVETLRLMAQRDVRMELNPGHVARSPEFFARVVEMGKGVGLRFVVGTDAHNPESIAYGEQGLMLLEQIGLQDSDIALPSRVLSRVEDATFRGCSKA
jgi:histidinol phosphatase-like PHP family hydrolase